MRVACKRDDFSRFEFEPEPGKGGIQKLITNHPTNPGLCELIPAEGLYKKDTIPLLYNKNRTS